MEEQIKSIKDLAIRNEIDFKEIAKISGIDQANISRIFNGKTDPRLKTYNKIVNAIMTASMR